MVSYFVPRGRFLIKAGNLRQVQHHSVKQHQSVHQQFQKQQEQYGIWPIFRQFRQSFSTNKSMNNNNNNEQKPTIVKCIKDSMSNNNHAIKRKKSFSNENGLAETNIGNAEAFTTLLARRRFSTKQQRGAILSKWSTFLLRWAPLGFCLFGAVEWQLHKYKCDQAQVPRVASEFQAKIYCSLPLRLLSRCWGWLAACYVPVPMRSYIYGWYSKVFNVNLDEALYPDYRHYNSLAEFFTRPLRDGVRPIDAHSQLVSPADGKVLHFGSATNAWIEQVKGVNYSVETFLGPASWSTASQKKCEKYEDAIKEKVDNSTTLYQCVIYLAPGDYHRFHSPANWQPAVRRHFSGELLSVSPKVATWLPGLFCLNERVVYLGSWKHGFFSYTAVGATNVGSVQIYMDDKLKTNQWVGLNFGTHNNQNQYEELRVNNGTALEKGDLVGQFNMGSTIVLLFEAPKDFHFDIKAGQKIRVGQTLGHFIDTTK